MIEVTINIYADYTQKNWDSNGSRKSLTSYFNKLSEDPT